MSKICVVWVLYWSLLKFWINFKYCFTKTLNEMFHHLIDERNCKIYMVMGCLNICACVYACAEVVSACMCSRECCSELSFMRWLLWLLLDQVISLHLMIVCPYHIFFQSHYVHVFPHNPNHREYWVVATIYSLEKFGLVNK